MKEKERKEVEEIRETKKKGGEEQKEEGSKSRPGGEG